MRKTARVYALVDEQGDIRYVGYSGLDLAQRAAEHHRHRNLDLNRCNVRLNEWLRSLPKPPQAVLLQEVDWEDRLKSETEWTRWARGVYGDLVLNRMDGQTPTEELKAERRAASTPRRPHTAEGRANISAGMKRLWATRKALAAEQARLEQEIGGKLHRIPRNAEELHSQLATEFPMAA